MIDIRLEAQKIDIEFINYLGETEVPFCVIFTKADKIGKVQAQKNIAAYKKQLLAGDWAEFPQYFVTSSTESTGREEVLAFIDDVNQQMFKNEGFV